MSAARVVLHMDAGALPKYKTASHLALFPRIEAVLRARGGEVVVQARGNGRGPVAPDALHIVEGGRRHDACVLNCALAYLPSYWHLDPLGVLAESSIRELPFVADPARAPEAEAFYKGLQQRFAEARLSRYRQSTERALLPQGSIAVFLQGSAPKNRGQAYLGYQAMLRAVCKGADGRPVLAKAHPLQPQIGQDAIAAVQAKGLPVIETAANVHDLLACCAASVSINSAASVEGFLHGKPAILFGQSDFAVIAETVRKADEFPAALERALGTRRDYAGWMYWYFATQCLNIDAPDFESRLLSRFAAAGFGAERLGLRP